MGEICVLEETERNENRHFLLSHILINFFKFHLKELKVERQVEPKVNSLKWWASCEWVYSKAAAVGWGMKYERGHLLLVFMVIEVL